MFLYQLPSLNITCPHPSSSLSIVADHNVLVPAAILEHDLPAPKLLGLSPDHLYVVTSTVVKLEWLDGCRIKTRRYHFIVPSKGCLVHLQHYGIQVTLS